MTSTEADSVYHSLEPIGFDGWEHTQALRDEDGRWSFFLRRTGDCLPGHLIRSQNTFKAVVSFIENHNRWSLSHDEIAKRWVDEAAAQEAGRARAAA